MIAGNWLSNRPHFRCFDKGSTGYQSHVDTGRGSICTRRQLCPNSRICSPSFICHRAQSPSTDCESIGAAGVRRNAILVFGRSVYDSQNPQLKAACELAPILEKVPANHEQPPAQSAGLAVRKTSLAWAPLSHPPDHDRAVVTAEPETVRHRHIDPPFARRVRRVVEIATLVGLVEIDRRGNATVANA